MHIQETPRQAKDDPIFPRSDFALMALLNVFDRIVGNASNVVPKDDSLIPSILTVDRFMAQYPFSWIGLMMRLVIPTLSLYVVCSRVLLPRERGRPKPKKH